MTRIVVDASVATKWHVSEIHEEFANRLLRREYQMAAPSILASEFANVALQKFRRGLITRTQADQMASEVVNLPVRLFDPVRLLPHAYSLAQEFHPSV